jgi:methionyl-tRNA formyltransferase
MKPQLVILATDGQSTNMLYHALKNDYHIVKVILEERISRGELVQKRLKKFSVSQVAGQLLFQVFYLPLLRRKSFQRLKAIEQQFGLINETIPQRVCEWVYSANSEACHTLLKALNPDAVILCGTRILNPETLNCLTVPFVNIHAGITPLYRGVHGGYWALANNDPANCGVTVHLVDSGIDTGNILAQTTISPTAEDNFTTYPILQLAKGIALLKDCLPAVINGTATTTKNNEKGKLWYHPTLGEYLRIKREKSVV